MNEGWWKRGATGNRDPGRKKRECSNLLTKRMAEQVEGLDDDGSPPTIDDLWADTVQY
jgi:hypothetical protein